jgi:hypothetical protein
MALRRETADTNMTDAGGAARSFGAVVSSWAEPLHCESAYGCRRQASWLAIRHQPCGGHQSVCTHHYRKWMGAALVAIARSSHLRCTHCQATFDTVEQCICFRPL